MTNKANACAQCDVCIFFLMMYIFIQFLFV